MDHIDPTALPAKNSLETESLGEKIELIIQKLPPDEVTLNEIIEIIGMDSLLLLTIFLSLIFLVPVSIPGVSTVFGLGIIAIGVTRLFSSQPWLPARIAQRKLSAPQIARRLHRSLVWFHRLGEGQPAASPSRVDCQRRHRDYEQPGLHLCCTAADGAFWLRSV
jgi:hypothetical protein